MASKRRTVGRYGISEYVVPIQAKFMEKFPDSVPDQFIVDHVVKYFLEYIKEELFKGNIVSLFAFGKFSTRKRIDFETGREQYYLKLKFSKHFLMKLRELKGTNTDAEKRAIDKKRGFIQTVWEFRHAYNAKGASKKSSFEATVETPPERLSNPYDADVSSYTD
ncbi:hypothetical protein [Chroococcidiopsis sp.]|uniref:hypothetical protein n=1 Tax=Chroococcidiopsis sp. TaxID=3088168 RepID=UPI003F37323C